MTAEEKPEKLGLRGRIAHIKSAMRLLGGANTTGAIAAGGGISCLRKKSGGTECGGNGSCTISVRDFCFYFRVYFLVQDHRLYRSILAQGRRAYLARTFVVGAEQKRRGIQKERLLAFCWRSSRFVGVIHSFHNWVRLHTCDGYPFEVWLVTNFI